MGGRGGERGLHLRDAPGREVGGGENGLENGGDGEGAHDAR